MFHPPAVRRTAARTDLRSMEAAVRQDRVDQLVRAYRVRGHMVAQIDPLGLPRPPQPELDPAFYGFTEEDMDRPFSARDVGGAARADAAGPDPAAAQHLLPLRSACSSCTSTT